MILNFEVNDPELIRRLTEAGALRGKKATGMAKLILEQVLRDKMIDAVMDDKPQRRSSRTVRA